MYYNGERECGGTARKRRKGREGKYNRFFFCDQERDKRKRTINNQPGHLKEASREGQECKTVFLEEEDEGKPVGKGSYIRALRYRKEK